MQRNYQRVSGTILIALTLFAAIVFSLDVNEVEVKAELTAKAPKEAISTISRETPTLEPEPEPEPEVEEVYVAASYTEPKQAPVYAPPTTSTPTYTQPTGGREADIAAIARTLSGECWEHNTTDKRSVAEVILNRVSKGYGSNVTEVVSAPNQFMGYYNQSRPTSDNDWEIATQVVEEWYANDQQAFSNYLYFGADGKDGNTFRESY